MNYINQPGSDESTRNLIYIMAPSYSGSTLLTCLLATHPKIATIGELKATAMGDIDEYVCSCGALLRECGFWEKVRDGMNKKGRSFSLDNFGTNFSADSFVCDRLLRASVRGPLFEGARSFALSALPGCGRETREIIEQNRALIDVVTGIQGGEYFLDGSKEPSRLLHLLRSGRWDVKVIYMTRDGRGVTNSYMRRHGVPMRVAVREWEVAQREFRWMSGRLDPDRCLKVRYEDIPENPGKVMAMVYDFLGLDDRPLSADFNQAEHHILGNSMRLSFRGEIRHDEKWKAQLSASDLELFESEVGWINRELGYE